MIIHETHDFRTYIYIIRSPVRIYIYIYIYRMIYMIFIRTIFLNN